MAVPPLKISAIFFALLFFSVTISRISAFHGSPGRRCPLALRHFSHAVGERSRGLCVPPVKSVVTGGAGFIGSHLVDSLAARGDDVLVLDDFSSGKRENLADALESGAEVIQLDVADAQAMFEAVGAYKPENVFHLAAQIDVRRSMADPGFDARLNVVGTVNALEAATRAGSAKFVFTSTGGAIYGEGAERSDELPFAEDARCEPFSIYGQSKLAAEGYIDLYGRTRGLPATTVRLGNIYGPRQDPATEAGVVAIFCEAGAGRRPSHRLRHGRADPRLRTRRRRRGGADRGAGE